MTGDEPSTGVDPEAARRFELTVAGVRSFAMFLLDASGIIRTWNAAAAAMKGYEPHEIIGRHLEALYPDDERERGVAVRNLERAAHQGVYRTEGWRRRKDGSLFWAMIEIVAIREAGVLVGFCKITQDFTERRALQNALQREKERAEVTLRAIGDGVISVDSHGRVEFLNPAAESLTGWDDLDARGRPLEEVYRISRDPETASRIDWALHSALAGTSIAVPFPAILHRKDGTRIAIEDNESPIRGENGSPRGGVVVFRDVTAVRGRLQMLAHQATHDALTGLVNRDEFERRLGRALEHARTGPLPGALIYFDLDRFKAVNDTCGHEAGDELLRGLARLYSGLVRERDTLARLGGDEFALIIEHCTAKDAYTVAAKILHATENFELEFCGRRFHVGVSIGVKMLDDAFATNENVVHLADRACYAAKEGGRNRIHVSSMQ